MNLPSFWLVLIDLICLSSLVLVRVEGGQDAAHFQAKVQVKLPIVLVVSQHINANHKILSCSSTELVTREWICFVLLVENL